MIACLSGSAAEAGTFTLLWDPNPEPDVTGYKLSWGTASNVYSATIDVSNATSYVFNGADPTLRYFFVVQAYNIDGLLSPYSTEVTWPVSTAPIITTQPLNQTIASGTTASLSVVALGSGLSYQWYVGTTGTTTNPIAGATASSYTTPPLTGTMNYWVRVANSGGTADSTTATISIGVAPPTITTQPASQTIASGATASLSVVALGSGLSYQWYVGTTGTTTNPIAGATASSYTTPPLTGTMNYWVRVANGAGTADSTTATISVGLGPTILPQPMSQSIASGTTASLSVVASGSGLNYQWYVGTTGTKTSPIAGATAGSYTTPPLTNTRNYWVQVANSAGTADSTTATISIGVAPTITTQPADQTIASGTTASVNVVASGSGLSYQWYVGTTGATTTPITGATASSHTTPPLTSTTSYWVRVSNSDGTADSATATINVSPISRRQPSSDIDGDGKADLTVYRPSTGTWFIRHSNTNYGTSEAFQWGLPGDIPVSGDYDGDGKADLAVYRPVTGEWYVRQSSTGSTTSVVFQWGLNGDIPVPGDYDGDATTDLAVYRPATGEWYIRQSRTSFSTSVTFQWGLNGDVPVPADYDGDGKTDLAVHRPANGVWYVRQSSTSFATSVEFQWGLRGDIAVPGDYDGDGKTDLAVWRPTTGLWFIRQSTTDYATSVVSQWGLSGDIPVPGDFDGDGKTDLAVFRPSIGTWFLFGLSPDFTTSSSFQWGLPGDIPILRRE